MAVGATVARLAMFKKPELYDAFLQFPRKLFNQMWRAPHFFIRVSVLMFRMAEHVLFRDPPAARPVLAPAGAAAGTPEGDGVAEYEFDSTQEQVRMPSHFLCFIREFGDKGYVMRIHSSRVAHPYRPPPLDARVGDNGDSCFDSINILVVVV
jgi:hypothetical protein